VTAVMTAPSVVWTQRNVCFCTIAVNIVQPNPSATTIGISSELSVVPVRQPQMIVNLQQLVATELIQKH